MTNAILPSVTNAISHGVTNIIAQSQTNNVAQDVQSFYWGEHSEWFWAFGQFIAVVLTLVVVAWTLVYIARQVKLQTRQTEIQTKQTEIESMSHVVQTVCTIQDKWHSETMQRVRREVCQHWDKKRDDFDGASEHIANFFEELGTFFKIGAVPKETFWDVWSWNVEHYWQMFHKAIVKERKDCEETVYCEFERLFKAMRAISDQKSWPPVDEPSISKFIKREIKMTTACLEVSRYS